MATYKTNIGAFQADAPGSSYATNIGAYQTDAAGVAVTASIAGGFTGGGAIVLGVATPELASIAGGFTGGGSIMLLGSSAWAGQHDTKQYVVAIGNGQVWICGV